MTRQGNAPRPPIGRRLIMPAIAPGIVTRPAAIAAVLAGRLPRRIRNMRRLNPSQEIRR